MIYPNAVLQVFCKAPVKGSVKTRLMPELTAVQTVEVHTRLTLQTLELVCSMQLCDVQLWCTPTTSHPFFEQIAHDYPVVLKTQSDGDLGSRMNQAILEGLIQYQQVLLIGCDCPSFTPADFKQALKALNTSHDVVLAPTEDGGYSLIGANQPVPGIFQAINWSTPEVLQQTRCNLKRLGLNSLELSLQWDVDNYADYLRYIATND